MKKNTVDVEEKSETQVGKYPGRNPASSFLHEDEEHNVWVDFVVVVLVVIISSCTKNYRTRCLLLEQNTALLLYIGWIAPE